MTHPWVMENTFAKYYPNSTSNVYGNFKVESYDPDKDYGYACSVTLTMEIWPWFKIMAHTWAMNNNFWNIFQI